VQLLLHQFTSEKGIVCVCHVPPVKQAILDVFATRIKKGVRCMCVCVCVCVCCRVAPLQGLQLTLFLFPNELLSIGTALGLFIPY